MVLVTEMENSVTVNSKMSEYDNVPSPDGYPPPPEDLTIPEEVEGEHRKPTEDDEWSTGSRCWFGLLILLCQVLLHGALVLVIYWVLEYRNGFSWTEDPKREFNFHPVLMIAGFIYFMGQAMLVYRVCRCCKRIYNKLFHTIFHILAIPAIVVGFMTVLDSHNLADPPIPNFYSLHSWLGLITMGLFVLQFVFGFFSFLVLLCCESATAAFRASLVPVHKTFGITTFMLAIATAVTGLTEKAIWTLGKTYSELPDEAFFLNALAVVLTALGILMPFLLHNERYHRDPVIHKPVENL